MGPVAAQSAEILALHGLAWIMGDEDRAMAFLSQSGLDLAELRALAGSPETLGAVLDSLLGDEAALVAFAAWAKVDPASVARARPHLPGTWISPHP